MNFGLLGLLYHLKMFISQGHKIILLQLFEAVPFLLIECRMWWDTHFGSEHWELAEEPRLRAVLFLMDGSGNSNSETILYRMVMPDHLNLSGIRIRMPLNSIPRNKTKHCPATSNTFEEFANTWIKSKYWVYFHTKICIEHFLSFSLNCCQTSTFSKTMEL